ncbi:hypothetical protein [Kocuria sp.]|uniref:hypothetical protein n=1 Tax=Kocuria sp. TaxID=1871328 RepID=UPI0026DD1828|nr:hypothetical protein [Kocuria sp.]MDO4919921.1 hypothetical protein [Kocuria sp.]
MTEYKPQRGERAVFHGFAVGSVEVFVANHLPVFASVGKYDSRAPGMVWHPVTAHGTGDVRPLAPGTQAWAWDTLCEAKRRHEAGEDLAPMATHELVKNESNSGMHLAPIETKEDPSC